MLLCCSWSERCWQIQESETKQGKSSSMWRQHRFDKWEWEDWQCWGKERRDHHRQWGKQVWLNNWIPLPFPPPPPPPLDWDSQSLYGSHLRKWRTESRDWEQNMQTKAGCSWNSTNTAHAHLCLTNLPNNDSDWPVSKYSLKHGRQTAPCTAPHRITHGTALRESLTHWSVVEHDSAHVYLCAHFQNYLFISPRIWAPSQEQCGKWRGLWMESVYPLPLPHTQLIA